MATFTGFEPWQEGNEIVEVRVNGELFDLHNDAYLLNVEVLSQDGGCSATFDLCAQAISANFDKPWVLLTVKFLGVTLTGLRADMSGGKEPATLHSFAYWAPRSFEVETDWLDAEFDAQAVEVSIGDLPMSPLELEKFLRAMGWP